MSTTFWIYKPHDKNYFIAKLNPFGGYERVLNIQTGVYELQLIRGAPMTAPSVWDWKRREDGRMFAGLKELIYDITDLELTYNQHL